MLCKCSCYPRLMSVRTRGTFRGSYQRSLRGFKDFTSGLLLMHEMAEHTKGSLLSQSVTTAVAAAPLTISPYVPKRVRYHHLFYSRAYHSYSISVGASGFSQSHHAATGPIELCRPLVSNMPCCHLDAKSLRQKGARSTRHLVDWRPWKASRRPTSSGSHLT